MEQTFVFVKPLGVKNMLLPILSALRSVGEIRRRVLVPVTEQLISAHYAEHSGKAWFPDIVSYYVGKTVMAVEMEGMDVIARVRAKLGPSDPRKAAPDQIRALVLARFQDGKDGWRAIELVTSGVDNFVHASDSPTAASRELALWFGKS